VRTSPLRVDDVDGPNWGAAIAMLRDGQYAAFRGVGLMLVANVGKRGEKTLGAVVARLQARWLPENLTRERALTSFLEGQDVIDGLITESPDIRELIQGRGLVYQLMDDYETGSVLIATMTSGTLEWHLPRLKHEQPSPQG
jgi:hypothetical protein